MTELSLLPTAKVILNVELNLGAHQKDLGPPNVMHDFQALLGRPI